MTVVRTWVGGSGTVNNADEIGAGRYTVFNFSTSVTVPTKSHILKVVASCGLSAFDRVERDVDPTGYPMVWQSGISLAMPPWSGLPFGRVYALNEQAGEYAAATSMRAPFYPAADGTTIDIETHPGLYATTWHGHMQPVDQSMSYGGIHADHGDYSLSLGFTTSYFRGGPFDAFTQSPGAALAYVFRVLYEGDDGR
jgi:hypothetical protein